LDLLKLDACHPDDKPLWWLVLRWMKVMFLKIARSYHVRPLLLTVAPMSFGILLGFWIGRRPSQSKSHRPEQTHHESKNGIQKVQQRQRIHQLPFGRWAGFLCASWYRLVLVYYFRTSQIITSTLCVNGSPKSDNTTAKINACPIMDSTNIFVSNCGNEDGNCTGDFSDDVRTGLVTRENEARNFLKSNEGTKRESDVPAERVPRHVAVIMDGNRRYGKLKYGSVAKGHWDGSSKLVEFAKWCIAEDIAVLTVFAFSSENWKRDPSEVASLMQIFIKYCEELRVEAIKQNFKIKVLSTDFEQIPRDVLIGVKRMVKETQHCDGMIMNICLSYGSRGEIVGVTKSIVEDVLREKLDPKDINENTIGERLLTHNCGGDPDLLIRTSGEVRISNFLLWQLAYTELFFVDKPWPAIEKDDLLEVIRAYAKGRNRRYGK